MKENDADELPYYQLHTIALSLKLISILESISTVQSHLTLLKTVRDFPVWVHATTGLGQKYVALVCSESEDCEKFGERHLELCRTSMEKFGERHLELCRTSMENTNSVKTATVEMKENQEKAN